LKAEVGGRPALEEVEKELKTGYKLVTLTHVDTSTGVITDVKGVAALAKCYGALTVLDGVCSVAGEEIRMSAWGIDVVLTASQKAVGVPPGLALLVVSPAGMAAFKARKSPVLNYYADWTNWLPVMQAYEARKTAYFGTPAVNLIFALNVSLGQILAEGMDARISRHIALSEACKSGIAALGLGQVPLKPEFAAHTMTAPRYPQNFNATDFLAKVGKAGATLAGGLHPAIKAEYFRIGHMGSASIGDVLATIGAVEAGLAECDYSFQPGVGVSAAQAAYYSNVR
jgi:alanine-glyoxylate transaminase / serine-glyoxylate transaminase / serine-pyruvate transaminase